jgi:hypothetical protein
MKDVMMRNLCGLKRVNAAEAVQRPDARLNVFDLAQSTTPPASSVLLHVTRSQFLNERVTAGRHGGPFRENVERTFLRVGGSPGQSDYLIGHGADVRGSLDA